MTVNLERRRLIVGGALGVGAMLLPFGCSRRTHQRLAGFTHNVASGEPGADSMLLWTRYVPSPQLDEARLDAEVALGPDFTRVVSGGSVRTGAYRDWTAKLTVDGLQPRTNYWYRFIASDGGKSPVGRTRTLPVGDTDSFGLGVFSCANLPVGWFNAYAHAAARDDLDLWLHVGDYIYEYPLAVYGKNDLIAGRNVTPAHGHEAIELADYRLRLACYRADPDLQKLHQRAPMIALWDDHDSANDSWEGGAQNHQPKSEGDWSIRRAASIQAHRECLPISEEPWKAYHIGTLATLYRTESRLLARTRPAYSELSKAHKASNPEAALRMFRDRIWRDPAATLLGSAQECWLASEFERNAAVSRWQIVGMAAIMGRTLMPDSAPSWVRPEAGERVLAGFKRDARGSKLGVPMWMDRWDGYPAARARLLTSAQRAGADLVILSGDSHNAWAYSLVENGQPAGIEFATHSVTSPGIERELAAHPNDVARAFVTSNPELVWADTSQRGYTMLNITPQRVTGEWLFMKTIQKHSTALTGTHRISAEGGSRKFTT